MFHGPEYGLTWSLFCTWKESLFCCYWMEKSTDNNYLKLVNSIIQVFRAWGRVVGKKNSISQVFCILTDTCQFCILFREGCWNLCVFVHFSLQFISFSSVSIWKPKPLGLLCSLGQLISLSLWNAPFYPWEYYLLWSFCLILIELPPAFFWLVLAWAYLFPCFYLLFVFLFSIKYFNI